MTLATCAAIFCLSATLVHLLGALVVSIRCRERKRPLPLPRYTPPVTIIRPVCRVDNFERETLASTFALDYPDYEVIFCLARGDDPVDPIVRGLIEADPGVNARLLVGEDNRSANPKLNNILKGWDSASHSWIILADSNVLMPRDYIQRMLGRWRSDTGLVCSMPIGSHPRNFWAALECAFLNTFEARWQYMGETLGFGFAQGKSMLVHRDVVDRAGGLLKTLGAEIAEDAAFTKMIHDAGLRVHLVDAPFEQPLGVRTFSEVWSRQRRWATLRRTTFPVMFILEILTGALLPVAAGIYAGWKGGAGWHGVWSELLVLPLLVAIWLGSEAVLARSAGWYFAPRMLAACAIRDLLLPVLWVSAWLRDDFNWRGNEMNIRELAAGDELGHDELSGQLGR